MARQKRGGRALPTLYTGVISARMDGCLQADERERTRGSVEREEEKLAHPNFEFNFMLMACISQNTKHYNHLRGTKNFF